MQRQLTRNAATRVLRPRISSQNEANQEPFEDVADAAALALPREDRATEQRL